jgi:hypothetical protein
VPLKNACVLCFQQSPCDSAGPEVDVSPPLLADRPLDRDVRDLDPAARGEGPVHSAKTASLSGRRSITPFEMTTSKASSTNGSASTSPSTNSTFVLLIVSALARALASICGVMSMPVTCPAEPTICAAISESVPAPEPRSSTRSPGRSRPSANGFATPAKDSAALSGTFASRSGG